MADDQDLANRIRELIADEPSLAEQRMFGGLAFLVAGSMAVAASDQGGLLVRVDPATSDRLAANAGVEPMEMRGRALRGWLRDAPSSLRTQRQLRTWVECGVRHAQSLPSKPSGSTRG